MLDDLREIKATLVSALARFGKTPTGVAWDGDLTNAISPDILAQIIAHIDAELELLEPWLTDPPLTEWESDLIIPEFMAAYEAERLTAKRFDLDAKYGPMPFADLATVYLSGQAVPMTPIPKRGDADAKTDLIPQNSTDYSGSVQPGPTIAPAPAGQGPAEPSLEQ